jgi:hypothetical protein
MSKYPLVIKHTLKIHQTVLVGGFTHLEKYESQWDGLSHVYYGKLQMFETTSQCLMTSH